ncbi:MAG: phosphoserine phosphatase SerB [Actinomycetia bacterium]|nr:phosphoserine phosphatase SerB [Actinomycetes bacterium]
MTADPENKRLVVMDVDSTFIQQEVVDLLAEYAGVGDQVAEITAQAMAGGLDFAASLRARVALLAGLSEQTLAKVRAALTLTPGAAELVDALQTRGDDVALVSGGFEVVIAPLADRLGIKYVRANHLQITDGHLTGQVAGQIIDRSAKAAALREFAAQSGVAIANTVAVGDGANDIDMVQSAGLGIAFNAKPALKQVAEAQINTPSLLAVLPLMER